MLACGEGKSECHTKMPADKSKHGWDCAGLAIFRRNICKDPRDPKALRLPKDTIRVFASTKEFMEHHSR